jgi:hypothetical protein
MFLKNARVREMFHFVTASFDIPNLMSIFLRLGLSSKESVQVRGCLWSFVTSSFLTVRSCYPTANSQAGGPPLVDCPRLLIHYIRSCPPYLEAVSSIRNLRTRHAVVTRDPSNPSRKMRCAGHVARMGRRGMNAYRLLVGKPEGKNTRKTKT